jgi:hypothetical protein
MGGGPIMTSLSVGGGGGSIGADLGDIEEKGKKGKNQVVVE